MKKEITGNGKVLKSLVHFYHESNGKFFTGREDRDFLWFLLGSLIFYSLLGALAYSIPQREMTVPVFERVPPRTARLILQLPKPPEVVPPVPKTRLRVPEEKKVLPSSPPTEPLKPVPKPKIEVPPLKPPITQEQNREVAKKSGLLKLLARKNPIQEETKEEPLPQVETLTSLSSFEVPGEKILKLEREEKEDALAHVSNPAPEMDEYLLAGRTTTVVENPFEVKGDPSNIRLRSYDSIFTVIQSHQSGIEFLYNKALQQDPQLMGQIVFEFKIFSNGTLSEVRIISSTLGQREFEETLLQHIQAWRFEPIPEGEVTIIYPIKFSPV